jgi:hypothetical protein
MSPADNVKIINNYLKVYLIGPMEKTQADDAGRGWRDKIRPELEGLIDPSGNPIYIFDPTREEQNKVGLEPKAFHKKLKGWISGGNNDKIAEGTRMIWKGKSYLEPGTEPGTERLIHLLGDVDYVLNSTFLIARMEEGDQPCGTYGEACMAFASNIPIYVLQTMPREKYPVTFTGWVFGSGGDFFPNQTQLIEFLVKKYNLKPIKK